MSVYVHTCRGFGHDEDQVFEFVDPGINVSVEQLSIRWKMGKFDRDHNLEDYKNSSPDKWWVPRTWSSSNLL